MIVYCEECGFKNVIDASRIQGTSPKIACENCGDFLRFYGERAKAIEELSPPETEKSPRSRLILKYGKVVVIVNETNARVEIGRKKSNDIQVINSRVSRTHAVIEFKNGMYYLTDSSSNGTYILMEKQEGVTIKNKEILLTERGVIGPGYKVDFKFPEAIHFWFEQ